MKEKLKNSLTISEKDKKLLVYVFAFLIIFIAYFVGYQNLSASLDTSTKQVTELTKKKKDLQTKNDNVGYKETINVSYEGTYAEWKNLIGFINNYEKKNTIEALTTTYNEATDVVTGTMTLALYSITGNGREFSEPKFDLKTGTDNIFAKPAE